MSLALALWMCLAGAPARAPFAWDVPEVIEEVPVGNAPSSGGRPMRVRAVRSRWSASKLRKKLEDDFVRAGLWIPPEHDQPQNLPLPYVAAVDGVRMLSYSAFFQVNRDGSTTLILGEVDLASRVASAPAAPVFPGAVGVLTSDVEAMRSVSFRAKARPDEVQSFYREVLGKAGFKETGPGTYERGPDRTLVSVQGPEADGMARVLVTTTAATPVSNAPPKPSH
jgi:hypothetical protein